MYETGFQKCANKINSLEDNSNWNGTVYTFLEDFNTFEAAKVACKEYNARILSIHEETVDLTKIFLHFEELFTQNKRFQFHGPHKQTLEVFSDIL